MENNTNSVSINEDVIAKMAKIAALEVEGVQGLSYSSAQAVSKIKNAFKSGNSTKGIIAKIDGGVINIDIDIRVERDVDVKKVAESVQLNIKDKIQNMTGSAVSSVNVTVADIAK